MLREFRYAVRHLTRAPRFSLLAVLTLGLALAGTGALLSILNALVLRTAGGPEPHRLAVVTVANDRGQQGFVAYSAFEELASVQDVFEVMSGTTGIAPGRVEINGAIATIACESVTGAYHGVLGASASLGRLISQEDDHQARPVAVISHDFWRTRFASDPAIVRLTAIPIIEGRVFTWEDDDTQPQVVIVNATLARQLVGSGSAIGTSLRLGPDANAKAVEVVGVVRDASPGDARLAGMPIIYRPIFQERTFLRSAILTIHARDNGRLEEHVRRTVGGLGHSYITIFRSMQEQLARNMVTERTLFFLASFVGWLTVLLAALGIYALLTFSIGRRLREMGLRQALGASHLALIHLIAREGLVLIVMGILLGVPLALGLGRVSRALLAELPWASHGGVLAAASVALMAAGCLAVAGPAWRAARTDPADALRGD